MKDPKKEYEKSHRLIIKEALSDESEYSIYDLCTVNMHKELEVLLTGSIKENEMEKVIFEAIDPWEIVNYSE